MKYTVFAKGANGLVIGRYDDETDITSIEGYEIKTPISKWVQRPYSNQEPNPLGELATFQQMERVLYQPIDERNFKPMLTIYNDAYIALIITESLELYILWKEEEAYHIKKLSDNIPGCEDISPVRSINIPNMTIIGRATTSYYEVCV